jgi:hypothetical protein
MARHTKRRQPTCELARAPAGLRPAGARNIVILEQKSLPMAPARGRQYLRLRALVHDGLISLCKAWTMHTLKQAMADVASTSAQDYQEFGLDKAEILMELRRLRDGIESGGAPAPASGYPGAACPLAIVVTRSARGALAHNPLFRPRTPA